MKWVSRGGKDDVKWHDPTLQDSVQSFLKIVIGRVMDTGGLCSLLYHTEATVNGCRFRAHPICCSLKGKDRGWHDLATARSPVKLAETVVPVHLIGFLCFDGLHGQHSLPKKHNCRGITITSDSRLAIVHSFDRSIPEPFDRQCASHDQKEPHQQTRLLSIAKKRSAVVNKKRQPSIYLVPIDDIKGKCIGVPDLFAVSQKVDGNARKTEYKFRKRVDHTYIFVKPKNEWSVLYRDYIRREVDEVNRKESRGKRKRTEEQTE